MYPPRPFYSINYYPSDQVTDKEKQLIQDFGGGWRKQKNEQPYILEDPVRQITIIQEVEEYWIVKSEGHRRDGKSFHKKYRPKGDWDSIHVFRWLMELAGLLELPRSGYIADYEC